MMAAASDESTVLIGAGEKGIRCLPDEEEKPSPWIHFGPTYGEDTEVNRRVKESAWRHIVNKTRGSTNDYMRAIDGRVPDEFVELMVKDGCFFLQLALHILGAGALLGYPTMNPYFGEKSDSSSYIPAMFYIGNQIPYVVIDALMKKSFFSDVIEKGKWSSPAHEDPAKLVLYQTVVEPQLMTTMSNKKGHRPPPSIMLTALRNALLESNDNPPEMIQFHNLELGYTTTADKLVRFPRANELKRSGVKLIKKKAGIGITNIRFQNRGYSAHLYLPPFHIHTYTIHLLTSLVKHEQSLTETDREITAYISFMRDLAPTYKDFKILQDLEIIQVHDSKVTSTFMSKLNKIVPHSHSNLTTNFSEIMHRIKEYETVPWQRLSFTYSIACGIITFFLAVFTTVQTFFTVLAYYYPPN